MKHLSLILCFLITSFIYSQTSTQYKTATKQLLDSIKTELEAIFIKDQTFRRIYKEVEEKLEKDSEAYEYFWEVVENQDKVLEKEVLNIIDKYGWLGISQVGRLANTTLWSVLQHGSVTSKEKYAPLLKESVLKKESRPIHYARLIDRMLINSDKAQLYGTQINYDNKEPTFYEIKQPEFVDKRRNEIGLNSLKEYATSRKIEWNITQKR